MSILASSIYVGGSDVSGSDVDDYKDDTDEKMIIGGYSVSELVNNGLTTGGSGSNEDTNFDDLLIPLGTYYDTRVVHDFYNTVKSSVIEDDLFDKLFGLVSKNKSKPTRKNVEHNSHKKTRRI